MNENRYTPPYLCLGNDSTGIGRNVFIGLTHKIIVSLGRYYLSRFI